MRFLDFHEVIDILRAGARRQCKMFKWDPGGGQGKARRKRGGAASSTGVTAEHRAG